MTEANPSYDFKPAVFESEYIESASSDQEPPCDEEQVNAKHPHHPDVHPTQRPATKNPGWHGSAAPKPSVLPSLSERVQSKQKQNNTPGEWPKPPMAVYQLENVLLLCVWLSSIITIVAAVHPPIHLAAWCIFCSITLFLGQHIIARLVKFAAWVLFYFVLTISGLGLAFMIVLFSFFNPFFLFFSAVAACMLLFTAVFTFALVQVAQAARP